MGWLDIFGKKGPNDEAIAKQVRKAKEPYAQPDYRRMAMDQLLKWDTEASLAGLLERFTVVVQSPHWDEEEKTWLVEELVERGEKSLPILRKFILDKNEVNHALLAYSQIIKDPKAFGDLLIEALERRPPSDHRSVQGKQEILAAMMEQKDRRFDAYIFPHLEDHSDDVQCIAIEALADTDNVEIKNSIAALLGSDAHSARVVRTAAAVVANRKYAVPKNIVLSEVVGEDFRIDDGHLVPL